MKGAYRLSIAGFLWAIAFVGVWLAAVRSGSAYWTAVAGMIAIGAVLTAVLGVVWLRGPSRSFCLGFALFFLGYSLETRIDLSRVGLVKVLDKASFELATHAFPRPPWMLFVTPTLTGPPQPEVVPSVPYPGYGLVPPPMIPAPPPDSLEAIPETAEPVPPLTPPPLPPPPPAQVIPAPPTLQEVMEEAEWQSKVDGFQQMFSLTIHIAMGLFGGLIALALSAASRDVARPGAAS